jgi:hypothetical protein
MLDTLKFGENRTTIRVGDLEIDLSETLLLVIVETYNEVHPTHWIFVGIIADSYTLLT